jgi:acetyl esterase/lipase
MMRFVLVVLVLLAGCDKAKSSKRGGDSPSNGSPPAAQTLADARSGFQTALTKQLKGNEPVETPPPNVLRIVQYSSPAGNLAAYLSNIPKDGKKHPAIIWICGGFGNDIGDTFWKPASPSNDQSASAFRAAGVVTMYPSFRGGNKNPGVQEGFFGEVDDVLAAADFLAAQEGIDPARIYLGGHSTGGTLALLVAETGTTKFRAIFSFGPVANVGGYGQDSLPFDGDNEKELQVRAPILWLRAIAVPTFVFEGASGTSNVSALDEMSRSKHSESVQFYRVNVADHFSILAPMTRLLAKKVIADTDPAKQIEIDPGEPNRLGYSTIRR